MDAGWNLKAVIAEYQKCVNTGDAMGYASLFTDDVVWMPPNAPDRIGRQAVLDAQSANFEKFSFSLKLTPSETHVIADDWGYVIGSVRGTLTPKAGGDVVDILFSAIFVMNRQADGNWRIARQMWNNKPPR